MSACILYLESQKAKMVSFDSDLGVKSKDFESGERNESEYFHQLAENIMSTSEFILVGPDAEKGKFRKYLAVNHRNLGNKLVGIVTLPELSIALAQKFQRKYFR